MRSKIKKWFAEGKTRWICSIYAFFIRLILPHIPLSGIRLSFIHDCVSPLTFYSDVTAEEGVHPPISNTTAANNADSDEDVQTTRTEVEHFVVYISWAIFLNLCTHRIYFLPC